MALPPASSPSTAKVRRPGDICVDGMLTSPCSPLGDSRGSLLSLL